MTLSAFIVFNGFGCLYPPFAIQWGDWFKSGKMQYRKEMNEGLERAPAAFVELRKGEVFGKRLVRLTV